MYMCALFYKHYFYESRLYAFVYKKLSLIRRPIKIETQSFGRGAQEDNKKPGFKKPINLKLKKPLKKSRFL